MGGGRKTQTFVVTESSRPSPFTVNAHASSRNLNKDDLGGVVFGCKHSTMKECLSNQLFGSTSLHISYVRNIRPGLPLFLFNYSDRKLHGIYEAASHGELNINPYGWSPDGTEKTQYPAQVRVCVREQCKPLSENQFRGIIEENFYTPTHFWFELDHRQVKGLIATFRSTISASSSRSAVSESDSKKGNVVKVFHSSKPLEAWSLKNNFLPSSLMNPRANDSQKNLALQGNKYGTLVSDDWEDDECSSSKGSSSMHEDGDNKPLDSGWDVPTFESQFAQEKTEDEEEIVLFKLKQLVKECKQSLPSCTNGAAADSLISNAVQNDEICPLRESLISNMVQNDEICPQIAQIIKLRQDIEELRNLSLEHMQQVASLETRQVESNNEIVQLKARVRELELKLETSVPCTDEPLVLHLENSIFLIGGYDGSLALSTLDAYSPSEDMIKFLKPMCSIRSHASSACLSGHIYVFGGGNGSLWYDTVERYNPCSNEWSQCPPLACKKGGLAGAAVGDKIFVVGGGNGVHSFYDVEMYDPQLGRWIPNPNMLQKRFAHAAAEINGSLYVMGGYDGKEYLRSAERFDPREASWTSIGSMAIGRGSHCAVALKEKLYVLGGYDGKQFVSGVEVFDPRNGCWVTGAPMINPRGYGAAAVLRDSIYAIAGLKGELTGGRIDMADTVECFTEGLGWQATGPKAIAKRCFLTAAVL